MFRYFAYMQQNIFKRKAIWISIGIYWLYLFLVLIFVPIIVKLPPTTLWNNTVFDLQSFSTLILSIICAITSVVIFREGRDDGSELIIMSKSISRWKIIFVKFIWFILVIFVTTILSMIIMLGIFSFGKYNAVTNPKGVVFKDVLSMEMGLLLATSIIMLFFGSIAILISTFANKVLIMISTIGIAIVFNVIYMLVPILSVTSSEYILDKYSVNLHSTRYIGIDGQMHDVVNSDHVRFTTDNHDDPTTNWNTLRYINDGNAHATGAIISYINVGQQLSSLFHAFDNSTDISDHSSYGNMFNHEYWLTDHKTIFENPSANSRPWITFTLNSDEGINRVNWRIIGQTLNLQGIYSIAGSQSNSLFYIRPTSTDILSLASSKFYGVKDFMNFFNEAAYAKTRAYVDSLESFDLVDKWFGYNKNIDSTILNPYGTKSVFDLREQFAKDLLENEESLIYYNNADFPLPYHVQPNDSKYNDAMNVDFLTIFYMLIQDVETNLWRDIDLAIANGSDTKGLPPFNAWTDKGDTSIYQRLARAEPYVGDQDLRLITQANSALVGGHPLMFSFFSSNSSTNCYAFSTYYSDQAGDQHYANDRYVFDKFNNTLESSDVFSSIYAYDQAAYYSSTGLVIVWICFALTLFGITALVYARTDVK